MQPATKFEDVIAWQKARVLTAAIYAATNTGAFAKDFGLRDQIQRASVSIMANIAEGFERRGAGEYAYFLNIAKASCAEVQSHLYVASDVRHLPSESFEHLLTMAKEVGRIIGGLRATIIASKR